MMLRDLRCPDVTPSHLEVAVEGRKLAYTVRFAVFKAVASKKRQSRDFR